MEDKDDRLERDIERGQMWWADIPRDRCNPHSQHGLRPVVVIGNDKGNAHSPCILVCPLTTQKDKYTHIHPNVMGVNHTLSYVLCEQIKVLDRSKFGKYIGKVRDIEQKYIDKALAVSIDLISYLEELETTKTALADVTSQLSELQTKLKLLEEENKKFKQNEDATNIGLHVQGILDILRKPHGECAERVINIQEINKPSDQPSNNAREPKKADAQPTKKEPMSAIDRFINRYAKYQKLNDESISTKESSKLSRPKAVKWTDEAVESFISDYEVLEPNELLDKYQLKSRRTAAEYYRRFRKGESL